jgi:hypothetical protein
MPSTPWRGAQFSSLVTAGGVRGLNLAAERLRALSVPRAPKQTGALRNTAQVTPATTGDPVSSVSYDTPYAVKQHEELDYRHDDGEAKYLEKPLREHSDELLAIIARSIRGNTDGR